MTQDLSAVIFRANPQPLVLDATNLDETEAHTTVSLKEDTPYYIQLMNSDGTPTGRAVKTYPTIHRVFGMIRPINLLTVSSHVEFTGVQEDPDAVFNFVPIPGEKNTFAISLQSQQKFIGTKVIVLTSGNTALAPYMSEHTNLDQVQNSGNYDDFKFVVEKESDGVYAIKQGNNPWKDTPVTGVTLITGETAYWRIITTNLDWSVEEIGTSMLSPILSEPTTDFGANNTLTNCGTGTLEQTIGTNQTQSFVNSVGWEESYSLTGSVSMSTTATVGVEFSAGFFGTKAKYSGSLSTTIESSVSVTQGSASFGATDETLSESIFFERTVSVPPGKASLVYDVAQIYDNTRVQFVQRFRLRATDAGAPLSGEELRSQLQFSRFSGVVTYIGSDFIDISVKGTTVLGKVFQTKSEVQDLFVDCK